MTGTNLKTTVETLVYLQTIGMVERKGEEYHLTPDVSDMLAKLVERGEHPTAAAMLVTMYYDKRGFTKAQLRQCAGVIKYIYEVEVKK